MIIDRCFQPFEDVGSDAVDKDLHDLTSPKFWKDCNSVRFLVLTAGRPFLGCGLPYAARR